MHSQSQKGGGGGLGCLIIFPVVAVFFFHIYFVLIVIPNICYYFQISQKLSKLYSEMIFNIGLVHCDPHPGNVLVKKNNSGSVELVLLDHGLYLQLTNKFRITYCKLWESLIKKDNNGIKKYCLELNGGDLYPLLACMVTARSWDSIQSGIKSVKRTETEVNCIHVHTCTCRFILCTCTCCPVNLYLHLI